MTRLQKRPCLCPAAPCCINAPSLQSCCYTQAALGKARTSSVLVDPGHKTVGAAGLWPGPVHRTHFQGTRMSPARQGVSRAEGSQGPPFHALVGRGDGCEGVEAQLQVEGAAAEVVHDADRVAACRQVQRRRPPAIPVPACMLSMLRQRREPGEADNAPHQPSEECSHAEYALAWAAEGCSERLSCNAAWPAGHCACMGMRMREVRSPMIMTRRPEPLLSAAEVTGGFSAVRTAVGPEGPRMSLACLGLRLLLGICTQSTHASLPVST